MTLWKLLFRLWKATCRVLTECDRIPSSEPCIEDLPPRAFSRCGIFTVRVRHCRDSFAMLDWYSPFLLFWRLEGIMRIVLFGTSGFSYWLTVPQVPAWAHAVSGACLANCAPTSRSVEHVRANFPQLAEPFHCLVPESCRMPEGGAVRHVTRIAYGKGSFFRIADGVYVPSPELCFVQAASMVSLYELIKIGSVLCGGFYFDPAAIGGLSPREPLTTRRRLEAFVRKHAGLKGIKKARQALPLLAERAASPPEIFLRSVLGLPRVYGGYGLVGSVVNRRVNVSKKARSISGRQTLVPDLCWPDHRLAVEYDSNSEHLEAEQVTRDATKRLALAHDRFSVITVTTRQLASPISMRHVAEEIARRTGRPLRIRGEHFASKHAALYRAGWSLNGYCSSRWLSVGDGASTPGLRR